MLFVGDDWAEGHHDIEIVDEDGKMLARKRLPELLDFLKPGMSADLRTFGVQHDDSQSVC